MHNTKTWALEETKLLIENYNKVDNSELQKLIPNKSFNGIYKKAYKMGLRKSEEIEFLNRSKSKKGDKSSNWNGGKTTNRKGYVLILCPGHHRADAKGYVMEHIVVWENATGIPVPRDCCIHHLNGKKNDNRIENLCLMKFSAHTIYHHLGTHMSDESKNKQREARNKFNVKCNLLNGQNLR